MVTEMSQAENCRMSQRKRGVSYEEHEHEAPVMACAGTQTEPPMEDVPKRPRVDGPPKPSNNGWGDLFKDRDTFVDMHIC